MIISKTPYRVSFFGGGTDYPNWYKSSKTGGKTICCAIDKFSYVVLKKLPDGTKGNILIIIAIIKQILAFDSKIEKSIFFISKIFSLNKVLTK